MEDRYDEVLAKYDFEVKGAKRVRGAVLFETDRGYKLIKETHTSATRLVWENMIKTHIKKNGFDRIDSFCLNNEGNISSADQSGARYVIKDWYIGDECDLKSLDDIYMASENMGRLHISMRGIKSENRDVCTTTENMSQVFKRHNAELKHIKNYIRSHNDKNEFEIAFLKVFPMYFEQAKSAADMLYESAYADMYSRVYDKGEVYHGSYTYHNILMCDEGIATTVFDKCAFGMQIMDLYYFIRKVMEKNEWDIKYGEAVINGYESVKKLSGEERHILAILLMYPEKFWKLSSYYMNGKKTLMTEKNMKKLTLLNEQFDNRIKFVDKIK